MNSRIIVDGKQLKLNRFIVELTGNILNAIAGSLKYTEGQLIEFRMMPDDLKMYVDAKEVPLNIGSASQIVRDVLTGLLKNLYGAENAKEVLLICERQ